MNKLSRFAKITIFHISAIALVLLFLSCGKQAPTDSQTIDEVSINSPIIYSRGWGGAQVKVLISSQLITENQANPSFQAILPQLQFAIDLWNNTIGRQVLILDTNPNNYLPYTGNSMVGCNNFSTRLYFPLCYNFNGIFYDRVSTSDVSKPSSQWTSGWVYNTSKDFNILATTIWNANRNTIISADVRFNRDAYVFADSTKDTNLFEDGSEKTLVDLKTVFLHELGHVLGLGHTTKEPNSIMYPTMNIGPDISNPNYQSTLSTTKRVLSTCDVNRIQTIYNNATPLPSSQCSVSN